MREGERIQVIVAGAGIGGLAAALALHAAALDRQGQARVVCDRRLTGFRQTPRAVRASFTDAAGAADGIDLDLARLAAMFALIGSAGGSA